MKPPEPPPPAAPPTAPTAPPPATSPTGARVSTRATASWRPGQARLLVHDLDLRAVPPSTRLDTPLRGQRVQERATLDWSESEYAARLSDRPAPQLQTQLEDLDRPLTLPAPAQPVAPAPVRDQPSLGTIMGLSDFSEHFRPPPPSGAEGAPDPARAPPRVTSPSVLSPFGAAQIPAPLPPEAATPPTEEPPPAAARGAPTVRRARVEPPRRRRRVWFWLGLTLGLLLLILLALVWGLQPLVGRYVSHRLEQLSARHQIQISYGQVHLYSPHSLHIDALQIEGPEGQLRAQQVEIALHWHSWREASAQSVHLSGVRGALDLEALRARLAQRPAAPAAASSAADDARPRPTLHVRDLQLQVAAESLTGELQVLSADGTPEGAQAQLRFDLQGHGALTPLRAQGQLALSAELGPQGLRAELRGVSDAPALTLHHRTYGQLRVTSLRATDLPLRPDAAALARFELQELLFQPSPHLAQGQLHIAALHAQLPWDRRALAQGQLALHDLRFEHQHPRLGRARGALERLTWPQLRGDQPVILADGHLHLEPSGTLFQGASATEPAHEPAAEPPQAAPAEDAARAPPPPSRRERLHALAHQLSAALYGLPLPPLQLRAVNLQVDLPDPTAHQLHAHLDRATYHLGQLSAQGDLGLLNAEQPAHPLGRFALHSEYGPTWGPQAGGPLLLSLWLDQVPLHLHAAAPAPLPPRASRPPIAVGATLSGPLVVHGDAQSGLSVVSDLQIQAGHILHSTLAEAPLDDLEGLLQVDAQIAPGHASLDRFVLGHKGLKLRAQGQYRAQSPRGQIWLKAAVDPTTCQAALDALPPSLYGPWRITQASGEWAPTASVQLELHDPNSLRFDIKDLVHQCTFEQMRAPLTPTEQLMIGTKRAPQTDVLWLLEPFIFQVTEGVSADQLVQVGPGLADYTPLNTLPPYVGGAAYLTEEMGFWSGAALSPGLTTKAIATDIAGGRFIYGGSTVTQQLVKNLFLSRDKTLLRKFREALIAGRVVDAVPKQRVLELYLNCIEFGPDLFGLGPAAQFYFQKAPQDLSVREAIFLAMLKPSPRAGASFKRRGAEPTFTWWVQRVHQVIDRLLDAKLISPEEAEAARYGQIRWDKSGRALPLSEEDGYFESHRRRAPRSAAPAEVAEDGKKI